MMYLLCINIMTEDCSCWIKVTMKYDIWILQLYFTLPDWNLIKLLFLFFRIQKYQTWWMDFEIYQINVFFIKSHTSWKLTEAQRIEWLLVQSWLYETDVKYANLKMILFHRAPFEIKWFWRYIAWRNWENVYILISKI